MLIALKHILQQEGRMSLLALSHRLKTRPDVIRDMLQHWLRKGTIRECQVTPACGSTCQRCPTAQNEYYEFDD